MQQNEIIFKAVNVLSAGGVVMHPTETCYGLAVDVRNPQALAKLYRLKGRDESKPVSILVSDLEMAKKYGEFSEKALKLAKDYWPGPLTILVTKIKFDESGFGLPESFNPGQKFVGIRCPDHKFSHELVKNFGFPITTTSANLAGEPPLYEADVSIFGELASLIDLVVDAGKIPFNKPSTIVKVIGDEVEVIRQGELMVEQGFPLRGKFL
ncbi:threonylcarbamoyl-AMP synthase [Candidatus Peregrinibacteria bacterium]|nr:threonylcarbamoyl-AMP synthase [Candidatus Peregrinibacteria bacterium]